MKAKIEWNAAAADLAIDKAAVLLANLMVVSALVMHPGGPEGKCKETPQQYLLSVLKFCEKNLGVKTDALMKVVTDRVQASCSTSSPASSKCT